MTTSTPQDSQDAPPEPLSSASVPPDAPTTTPCAAGTFGAGDWKRIPLAGFKQGANAEGGDGNEDGDDVGSNAVYYVSCATGESRWDDPSELAEGSSENGNETVCVWDQLVDEETGATYYRNQTTEATRWETRWEQYTNSYGQSHWYNNATKESQWEAPEWSDAVDPDSGLIYFTNNYTMESQWAPPPDWDQLADPNTTTTLQQQSQANSEASGSCGTKRTRSDVDVEDETSSEQDKDLALHLVHPAPSGEDACADLERAKRIRLPSDDDHAIVS